MKDSTRMFPMPVFLEGFILVLLLYRTNSVCLFFPLCLYFLFMRARMCVCARTSMSVCTTLCVCICVGPSIFKKININFLCQSVCVQVYISPSYVCNSPWRIEGSVRSSGAGVISSCVLTYVSAANLSLVLCKNSKCRNHWEGGLSRPPWFFFFFFFVDLVSH